MIMLGPSSVIQIYEVQFIFTWMQFSRDFFFLPCAYLLGILSNFYLENHACSAKRLAANFRNYLLIFSSFFFFFDLFFYVQLGFF